MLGFGFALFLMLVILALIYTQYSMQDQPSPSATNPMMPTSDSMGKTEKQAAPSSVATTPLPATVTPDTATADLIDEALADREDFSALGEDEMADLEEGN